VPAHTPLHPLSQVVPKLLSCLVGAGSIERYHPCIAMRLIRLIVLLLQVCE